MRSQMRVNYVEKDRWDEKYRIRIKLMSKKDTKAKTRT